MQDCASLNNQLKDKNELKEKLELKCIKYFDRVIIIIIIIIVIVQ